eukprot:2619531-Rhodomonas_salina.6
MRLVWLQACKPVNLDETLFVMHNAKKPCQLFIICMCVDDEAVCQNWNSKFNSLMQFLQCKLEVTHKGTLHWYLSVHWRYNVDVSAIMAMQTACTLPTSSSAQK